jgi:GntR family transcriptional repressor for pyruvate dehydrogenase complex
MISKTLLKEKVVLEIITLIAQKVYRDGQRLPSERTLSEKLNVSRGTLRDALAKLSELGILEIKPGSGLYVKKFSMKKIPAHVIPKDFVNTTLDDIIYARLAIEIPAVELACRNIGPQDIQKLEKLIEKMSAYTNDLSQYMKYDMEFHRAIIQAGKNKVLLVAFDAIHDFHIYSQIFVMEGATEHHRLILDSLKKRNVKAARKNMKEHLDDMEGYIHLK